MVIRSLLLPLIVLLTQVPLYAQQGDTLQAEGKDTAHTSSLSPYVITAYEQERRIVETPAGVGLVDKERLQQYSNTNVLPAVNTVPGVRMEERSPGSYRFAIRGSSVASPFGVRNIKVYYNGIPYTEAGGNTYLNQLGFYNFQTVTIIKGPGGSIYGAGTGGVLLINSTEEPWEPGVSLNYTTGSYGLSSTAIGVRTGEGKAHSSIKYQHLEGDGYRQQSKTRKDVLSWDAELKNEHGTELSTHLLYGDLYYQTPGALTLAEYNADPQQARPATAAAPGAIGSSAAIYQKTALAGISCKQTLAERFYNSTTLFVNYASQLNPNIRNYSRTSEPNFGGRTAFHYSANAGTVATTWIAGAEYLAGLNNSSVYRNVNGQPQSLQTDQEIDNRQLCAFAQASATVGQWQLSGGASINRLQTRLVFLSAPTYTAGQLSFNNQVAPRIALLRKIGNDISVYVTASKGFSPPTTEELAPTGSTVNLGLSPEQGWSYEAGSHVYSRDHRLFADLSIYYFSLKDAIVSRRDSAGGDQYINAGSTRQVGLEAYVSYQLVQRTDGFISSCFVYGSYTAQDFHYDQFVQQSGDYSGKQMPGAAPNTIAAGLSVHTKPGFYLNVTNFYSDRIALNDANTAYGNAYNNLGAKLGYKVRIKKYEAEIYAEVENMLNQVYSLGNDINAAGGRYYNAAAPVNYFAGLALNYKAGSNSKGL